MTDKPGSVKHDLIEKSNKRMIIMLGVAGAVIGFSLVASYNLIKQLSYRERVISARSKAASQLEENVESVASLVKAYNDFNNAPESVIGTTDKNAKIVLDALPSKYDFPALASSLDAIMVQSGFTEITIGGNDEEANAEQTSITPQPIEIPIEISGRGTYLSAQQLITNLQRSIRPFRITNIQFSGNDAGMNVTVRGITYYQPEKNLQIVKEEVK